MGSLSIWHWLIMLAVVVTVFGGGQKLSSTLGDLGRGIKVFKREIASDEASKPVDGQPAENISIHLDMPA